MTKPSFPLKTISFCREKIALVMQADQLLKAGDNQMDISDVSDRDF